MICLYTRVPWAHSATITSKSTYPRPLTSVVVQNGYRDRMHSTFWLLHVGFFSECFSQWVLYLAFVSRARYTLLACGRTGLRSQKTPLWPNRSGLSSAAQFIWRRSAKITTMQFSSSFSYGAVGSPRPSCWSQCNAAEIWIAGPPPYAELCSNSISVAESERAYRSLLPMETLPATIPHIGVCTFNCRLLAMHH